jgi:hypothetical protein
MIAGKRKYSFCSARFLRDLDAIEGNSLARALALRKRMNSQTFHSGFQHQRRAARSHHPDFPPAVAIRIMTRCNIVAYSQSASGSLPTL